MGKGEVAFVSLNSRKKDRCEEVVGAGGEWWGPWSWTTIKILQGYSLILVWGARANGNLT